jgi:filamentous hemagglutinin family protein
VTLPYLAVTISPLVANSIDPTPTVVTGQVDFTGLDTHSAFINQATQKAIVDYSHFNIPEGGSVQFIQPNSNAAILNRITGADPSLLNGTLTANGQVFFVNPAGVTFGANSVIRADVFMAAAGQMSNEDFLNNIQNFSLTGDIQTLGSIETERGVGLFGQKVENSGVIVSKNGYAIIASGDEVHVRQGGTGLSVDVTDASEGSKNGIGIKNLGAVDGEDVMFSAGDAFATAIQHSGTVNAGKSAKILSKGGVVDVSGEITARNETGQGGRIEVGGQGGRIKVDGTGLGPNSAPVASQTTITETAALDASSDSGDGGDIVVYSGGHTQFDGSADASSVNGNGGSLDVSGKTLDFENIDRISLGEGGDFIIDLEEVTINTDPDNTFNASWIETHLDSGSNFLVKTVVRPWTDLPGNGNINVNANIQVPTNNRGDQGSLTLDAAGDIIVAGGVTVENLQEGFASGESVFDFQAGGDIILNGDVRHSGINGEVGRGTISMAAGGEVLLNNTIIDANGGSVIIDAQKLTLSGFSGGILSGLVGENTASVDITATNEVNFAGGNIQTFGGSDVFIDTGLLTNNTGSTAVARTDLAESFFGIRLPKPEGNGVGVNHIYGGIQSGGRALFNVTEFDTVKTNGITGNQYYYNLQPTVGITAKDGSKIYGNSFNLRSGGAAVDVAIGDFIPVPLGDPFLADTTANALDLSGVTTTSTGAVRAASVGTNPIIANGAVSNNGYSFEYTVGTLTVDPRAVTLTATEQNKQYGDILALDVEAFTVTDLDSDSVLPNGDQVNTVSLVSNTGLAASTTSNVGNNLNEIRITGQSGNDLFNADNYTFTYEAGDLVINPRNVTVTASEQEKFYGDVLDLTSNPSKTAFTVLDEGLTDVDEVPSTLPNGETINTVSLQSVLPIDVAASTTENVGIYTDELQITGVSGDKDKGFKIENYNFTFLNGDLVVQKRPITLTPVARSKEYGEVLTLGMTEFTLEDKGVTEGGDAALPNGEKLNTVPLVSLPSSLSEALENTNTNVAIPDIGPITAEDLISVATSTDDDAKIYTNNIRIDKDALTSSDGSNGFNLDNYDVTVETNNLTIIPRKIELVAGRQEKFYGDDLALDNTNFAVVDQGDAADRTLPNGEEVTSVTVRSDNDVDNSTTSVAALYSNEIVIESSVTGTPGAGDGFLESNYDITYTSGDLLVNPRPITVSPVQQDKTYGDSYTLRNDKTAFTILDNGLTDGGNAALPNEETIDTVSIISRGGNDASTISDAVTYADDLEITGFGSGSNGFNPDNYSFNFSNLGDFVINRRAAQIIASSQEKDYGDVHDLGETAFTVVDRDGGALPNGETVNTVALVSENGIDGSTDANAVLYADNISVTPTSTNDPTITGSANFNQKNYTFSYDTGDLTVNRRAAQIIASSQEKDYGDVHDLGDTAFTVVDRDGGALPNGETVNTVTLVSENGIDGSTDANAVLYADNISVTPTSTNDPTITGSANFNQENYTFSYDTGDLTVNRRAAQIIASAQEKDYGDVHDLGDTAFTVVDRDGGALPNGETVNTVTLVSENGIDGSTDANAVLYADNISVTPTSTNDSTITGSANFNQENYTFSYDTGDLTVNRRAITLTANEQEKIYGDQLALDDTVFTTLDKDGDAVLPNGEVVTNVTINSATGVDASTTSDVATYTDEIEISGPVAGIDGTGDGFLESNYDITYVAGDLTVNRRAAQIIASSQEKDYGDVHDLGDTAFTVVDRDGGALPNGETVNTVTLVSENGIDGSTDANAVLYADNISVTPTSTNDPTITGSANFNQENYTFSYDTGDLTVNRRAITLTANEQEKIYGDQLALDDTVFTTLDKDGDAVLPNGEVVTNVTINSATGVDASTTSDVATYTDEIEISGPVAGIDGTGDGFLESNYDITYVAGDLTVNRRAAQIIASSQEKDYGDVHDLGDTAFTVVDRDGGALPNGETVNTVALVSENGIDGSTDANAVLYADNISVTPTSTNDSTITGSANFNQENYTFSYDTGDLTVNRRAITLTANEQEKIYGDQLALDDTVFTTLDKDGDAVLPNGEVVTNVTINSATGVDASTTSDVATYTDEIEISGPVAGIDGTGDGFLESNYDITYVAGDLTVNRRAAQIIASSQEKDYGDVHDLGDTAFTVVDRDGGALPNGETVNTVTLVSENGIDGSTDANAVLYADNISVTPTSTNDSTITGSANFNQENYTFSYDTGDLTVNRRAAQIIASSQEKDYGDVHDLGDTAFTVVDRDGGALPNGETVNTVTLVSENGIDGSTDANAVLYADNISVTPTSTNDPTITGSANFNQENYTFSYDTGDLTINRRAIELVIAGDNRYAGAAYQIDPAAFATIDLDGDTSLPNAESIDTLNITSLSGVAEDPSSSMGLYIDELDADPASAIGSNGFSLGNFDITITPGDFKIDPYPGLPAMLQDVYFEQWLMDNTDLDLEDPFSSSYAISQSLGMRLITLDSWSTLSGAKKQVVLRSLDAVPLQLQSFDLAEELIKSAQRSNKN